MAGVVTQVNISKGGVPKRPVFEGVVNRLGIEGDEHANPKYHGGPRQALLLIAEEALEQMKEQGFTVYPGALGENVTMRGVDVRQFRLGQRWRVGEVIVELTKIRVPCNTIKIYGENIGKAIYDSRVKAGDHTSPRWALSGVYTSVISGGVIHAGDPITLLEELA